MDEAGFEDAPPAGFILMRGRGPFSAHNGPFYRKDAAVGAIHGFRVRMRHANSYGLVHGGMMASFLDGLFAHAVMVATGARAVTVRLTADYAGMARVGQWITGRACVTGRDGDLIHVEGDAEAGAGPIVIARAVFKTMRTPG